MAVEACAAPQGVTPKRLLIYAHYGRRGVVSSYVFEALARYRPHVTRLTFVSASALSDLEQRRLAQVSDDVVVRDNVGYDFCSWRDGLRHVGDVTAFDEVIFANDSVIGPFQDPGPMLARLSAHPAAICGLTLNWHFGRHAQSYFLRYRRDVVASPAFEAFWANVAPLPDKMATVLTYEVGLTAFMEARGHRVDALFTLPAHHPLRDRMKLFVRSIDWSEPLRTALALRHLAREIHTNPVHHLWEDVIDDGLPFIKKELLRDNPLYTNKKRVIAGLCARYGVAPETLRAYAEA